jgi:hypothetical protein
MNPGRQRNAIAGLRWAVGVVVLLESCRLLVSSQMHSSCKGGPPHAIPVGLAWCETVVAVLFLVPSTAALGGYLLLTVFLAAAVIHVLRGQTDVGVLVVYRAAVLVCLAHRDGQVR